MTTNQLKRLKRRKGSFPAARRLRQQQLRAPPLGRKKVDEKEKKKETVATK